MKNLRFLLFLTLAAALTFVSCKKDDDTGDDAPPAVKSLKLVKATKDDGTYKKFTYNADNNLTKVNYYDISGNLYKHSDFAYTGKNMTEYTDYNGATAGEKITVTYVDGKPSSANFQQNSGAGLVNYLTLIYTFSGDKLTTIDYTTNVSGVPPTIMQKFNFTTSGANYTRNDKEGAGGSANGYSEYTYDNKKSPMHGVGVDFILGAIEMMSVNNTTMQKFVSSTGQIDQAQSVNTTYLYNAENYPTKQTDVSFDGNATIVITFTYEEK